MDRILKLLRSLDKRERELLESTLASLYQGNTEGLDIKKLRGSLFIYRARIGSFRVIFSKEGGDIRVLEVGRRNENTYRNY